MKYSVILCLALIGTSFAAAAARPSAHRAEALRWTAACDAPESVTVLWPAPAGASDVAAEARAVTLDRTLIHWPGAGTEGRFRLHRSLRGQLLAAPGERVRGSDGAITLQQHVGELPAALAERHQRLGDGTLLNVSATDAAVLPLLLREQLLLVREDEQGRVLQAAALQVAGALDDLYAAAADLPDLGVTVVAGRSTKFHLWAPTAQRVSVCLHKGSGLPAATRIPLQRDAATGAWALQIGSDLSGGTYTYMLEVAVPGQGVMRHRVIDPYAIALAGEPHRAAIASLDAPALKPAGWDTSPVPGRLAASTDRVVYRLDVRDFSINDTTVSAPLRGRYGAFSEAGSEGMRQLKTLANAGLTELQLLPALNLSGASDGRLFGEAGDSASRIVELRQMVMALHGMGLRVHMDLVDSRPQAPDGDSFPVFERVVPGYDRRQDAGPGPEPLMKAKRVADLRLRWQRQLRVEPCAAPGARSQALRPCLDLDIDLDTKLVADHPARHSAQQRLRQAFIDAPLAGPDAPAKGRAAADDPLRLADLMRAGLAGGLRDYVMTSWRDELLPLSTITHAGQPLGTAAQPGDVMNCVGLSADGARTRLLDAAIVSFSQGIACFDAGAASADLLQIRASSTLFRLRTAAEVQARLLFHNTGSVQVPTVLLGHLDGVGLPGAVFRDIVYLVNVDKLAHTVAVEPLKDRPFELHPVHTAASAADRSAAAATYDAASGSFTVPARTAVVFVVR